MSYYIWSRKGWEKLGDRRVYTIYAKKFEKNRANMFSGERMVFDDTRFDKTDIIQMYAPSKHLCERYNLYPTDICREHKFRGHCNYDRRNFTIIRNIQITNDLSPIKNGHKPKFFRL